jgi:hypothetical protein
MVDGLAILAGSKPLFGGNIQFVREPKIKLPGRGTLLRKRGAL